MFGACYCATVTVKWLTAVKFPVLDQSEVWGWAAHSLLAFMPKKPKQGLPNNDSTSKENGINFAFGIIAGVCRLV